MLDQTQTRKWFVAALETGCVALGNPSGPVLVRNLDPADARLIAAAPDLLEALRPMADWWTAYKSTCGNGYADDSKPLIDNFPLLTYGHCRRAAEVLAALEGLEAQSR